MKKQEPVTLTPGFIGRLLVSDILPVMLESNDCAHDMFRGLNLQEGDPKRYVRDYRTIRLDMGQRAGKTYACGVLARPGDLVVALTYETGRHIDTVQGVHKIGLPMLSKTATMPHYKNIWLMDFNLWPRTSMNVLREKLITSFDQRIIILG